MLFENDLFSPQALCDPRAVAMLRAAVDHACLPVQPLDVLAAAVNCVDAGQTALFVRALQRDCTVRDLVELLGMLRPRRAPSDRRFDGRRSCFDVSSLALLDSFEHALANAPGHESAAEMLLQATLERLNPGDVEDLGRVLSVERCLKLLDDRTRDASELLEPLFESSSGRLRSEIFSAAAWAVLERSSARAAALGYDRLLAPHLLLGLLDESEGVTEWAIRLQSPPDAGPARAGQVVADSLRLGEPRPEAPELVHAGIGDSGRELLQRARLDASVWGSVCVEPAHILLALIEKLPERLATVLQGAPLHLDMARLTAHLHQALADAAGRAGQDQPFRLPSALLPSEDLTYQARAGGLPQAVAPPVRPDGAGDPFLLAVRALHRKRCNHVLVTGARGVGKTAFVRELARRAAAGDPPFLARKRFLWVDAIDVPSNESRRKLEAVLAHVAGRTDLVVCLDGMAALLRAESGADNKLLLRAALKEHRLHLIGVMSGVDFEDLLGGDREMLDHFTRVEIDEPPDDMARTIVAQALSALCAEFRLVAEPEVVSRSVLLTAEYLLSERLPSKAIRVLRRIGEDLDFDRSQHGRAPREITVAQVASAVSEISGVPEETLMGVARRADYARSLAEQVIGQDAAVRAVADELGKIKMGLKDAGKPASVLFFAGPTGTGKTELAKAISRLYSSSKRLHTYAMGNYTEPHAVSAFVGVPPGYVGHEQGGRLINELLADPYGVFLLDEAEKAHPEIWKPFLHLFDEGWITDQRGVKAFAQHAIFILTSNAGAAEIVQLSGRAAPRAEMEGTLRKALLEIKHPRNGERVFAPEFLARITSILPFQPLDEVAMRGICDKAVRSMQRNWLARRSKALDIPDALIEHIARGSALANADGTQGARFVAKLLSELVDTSIQHAAMRAPEAFAAAGTIRILFEPDSSGEPDALPVHVLLDEEPASAPAKTLVLALRRLQIAAGAPDLQAAALDGLVRAVVAEAEAVAHLARQDPAHSAAAGAAETARQRLGQLLARLHAHDTQAISEARQALADIAADLAG